MIGPQTIVEPPPRIARLERDARGYPIPWNVLRGPDGTPHFTVNDDRRHFEAIRRGLCTLCGEILGKWKWSVGGPKSAFDPNGWYMDLPMHHECATYALQVCPYLALPKFLREIQVAKPDKLPPEARILLDETIDPARPDVFVAVAGSRIEISENRAPYLPYVRPMRPALAYEFWRHGRRIPQAEAMPILCGIFGDGWKLPEVEK